MDCVSGATDDFGSQAQEFLIAPDLKDYWGPLHNRTV